jgi:hypothetical protein
MSKMYVFSSHYSNPKGLFRAGRAGEAFMLSFLVNSAHSSGSETMALPQTTIVRLLVASLTLASVASGFNSWNAAVVPIHNQERSVTSKYLARDQSGSLLSRVVCRQRHRNQVGCSELQVVASSSSEPQDNSESKGMMNPLALVGLSIRSPSSFIFLILAVAIGLSRPIPKADVAFSICFPLYLALANRFRFDRNVPAIAAKREVIPLLREGRGPWFKRYVTSFGMIGVILPVMFQLVAPRYISDAAAPHLYLVLCQVVMETLTRGAEFYPLLRLLTPIGFNTYRMGSLCVWASTAMSSFLRAKDSVAGLGSNIFAGKMILWEVLGLSLALVNLVVWTYNLFIFLLLRTVPQYLDKTEFPAAKVVWKGQLFPFVCQDTAKN